MKILHLHAHVIETIISLNATAVLSIHLYKQTGNEELLESIIAYLVMLHFRSSLSTVFGKIYSVQPKTNVTERPWLNGREWT